MIQTSNITPEIVMVDLTGKTRDELIAMADELSCRNYERFVKYNQNFIISKAYDDEYKADQQVILDQMKPILEALGPAYLEDCSRERAA